ncbi:hypothetical protein EV175_007342, partial [Coemansia sp. RSA 1933]
PDQSVAEEMMRLSVGHSSHRPSSEDKAGEVRSRPDSGERRNDGVWVNAPQEPCDNTPQDPYENLLDEVDQLLGEIKDDDDTAGGANARTSNVSRKEPTGLDDDLLEDDDVKDALAKAHKKKGNKKEMDFQIDDDDDDDDGLAHILKA